MHIIKASILCGLCLIFARCLQDPEVKPKPAFGLHKKTVQSTMPYSDCPENH